MSVPAAKALLVGRDRELTLIDECLDAARRGEGSSLMLVGEPGSGKTALLGEARRRAEGFTVIGCTGVEWEAELPYGGLHELLGPVLGHLDALPDPQRAALEVALGLATGEGGQALHVLAGVLSLLTETTRASPVLVVADDLQWIDSPTCEALSFVVRRLSGEAVALLVGARPGAELPGLPSSPVPLEPLSREAVGAIAERVLGRPLFDDAAAELAEMSAGNPLAVVEALRPMGTELWERGTLLATPLAAGTVIEQGFADRINALSDDVRWAVEALSAAIDPSVPMLRQALERLGVGEDALHEAERAGIIEFKEAGVRFSHPVLRSVAYRHASAERIRACHAALAEAITELPELHAWHAACATIEPDEAVAHALEVAAEHFVQRGGSVAASQALARAAMLTPEPNRRGERLLRAAQLAYRAGRGDRAKQLFEAARTVATEPRLVLEIELCDTFRGAHYDRDRDVVRELEDHVERARGLDDDLMFEAATALSNEVTLRGHGARMDEAKALLAEVSSLPGLGPRSTFEAGLIRGHIGVLTATRSEEFEAARDFLLKSGRLQGAYDFDVWATSLVEALMWTEDFGLGQRISVQQMDRSRQVGDAPILAGATWSSAYINLCTGHWHEARSRFSEAAHLCRAIGNRGNSAIVASMFALLQAVQGDGSWQSELPQIEEDARRYGMLLVDEYLGAASGMYALGLGDAPGAIEGFGRAVAWQRRSRHVEPVCVWWPVDLVEAQIRVGDLDGARAGTEALRARAAVTGQQRLAAMVARLDGLLGEGAAADRHFEQGLVLGAETQDPYGVARTQLAFGRHLRRERRRADAREMLQAALTAFEALGAVTWAEQARRELEATGLKLLRGVAADAAALTPQESQVAELVAAGGSNKEVAGVLFLSPKTIETHLSRIYRKLGITRRTQLASALSDRSGV